MALNEYIYIQQLIVFFGKYFCMNNCDKVDSSCAWTEICIKVAYICLVFVWHMVYLGNCVFKKAFELFSSLREKY